MRSGWCCDEEAREAARRTRELGRLSEEQRRLQEDLARQREQEREAWSTGGAASGPSEQEWEGRLRAATGYSGPAASEVVGEREMGLADGSELARGPHIMFDMQRTIASFGGEQGWLQRGDVSEGGWRDDWR